MASEQLTISGTQHLELQAPTPMDLLKIAMSKDVDIEKLTRLWELNVSFMAEEARRAYNEAMTKFKANPPKVGKNKHVKFGNTEYDHATLDHATDVIGLALAAYGFSHKWSVSQEGTAIRVKCTIRHKQGHEESAELAGLADTSGSKNSIQAIGSTVTYLQRYTLFAVTGLAPQNGDDDAQSGGHLDDLRERIEFIQNCNTPNELKQVFTAAYKEAERLGDKKAMAALIRAKDERKKDVAA